MKDPAELSLADFNFSDSDNPLIASPGFVKWRESVSWAMGLYEPQMIGGPTPRLLLERAGKRHPVINLTSYNYLGLATHPEVVRAAHEALDRYGLGACGSPVLSGLSDLHRRLEARLAAHLQREASILFNSGFGGAMGALAGLLRKGDAVVLDEKCHLSLIAGATLSRAKAFFFKHNDPQSLDDSLKEAGDRRRVVVVEGIYSMDGDMADLPKLLDVAEKHHCGMFIDEAHSMLCWGEHGRGVPEHFGVEKRVGLVFATFSKAFGAVGGCVTGEAGTIDYLRFYSHPYSFSCALPPAVVAGLLASLDLATRDDTLRRRLWDNTTYFRERLLALGLNIGHSTTQVIPIIIGSNRPLLYEMCHEMNDKGLFLAPVDYPSVPEDQLRYRAAVSAGHTRQDLDEALQIIEDVVVRKLRKGVNS